jgi:protein transport protein SEC24
VGQGGPFYPASGQQSTGGNAYTGALSDGFGAMSLQSDVTRPLNLLQERHILPQNGVEPAIPNLPNEFKKANCNPEIMSCTLNAVPSTQSLLNKARLPLGLLIHPFKDLTQLPVIQSSIIVRCRSCRTYINPFVTFVDMRRWKCNLCYRVNELPDEFNYDPVSKSYGEPQRRPEVKSATIEFIAPSEYMLRPPQPAVYLFLLDVSFNAIETGYLSVFCRTLLDELDRLPGDSRMQVGFITYDSVLYFYELDPETSQQPKMLVVSDMEEVFIPSPEGLLVNLHEAREMVIEFLQKLPVWFEKNMQTGSALGPALQAAYKLMSPTGGRVTVVQTQLPTVGAGALKNREEPDERSGKKVQHLCPVTDFYKKLSLDCSAQQIAVDLFMLNSQYSDIATIAGIAKYSGGSTHYFPGFHSISNPAETEHFESTLRRYLTRKIGFEAVMRIRSTKGLSIHTFHGNFFVRSTDLLSLPNINPDAGFGVQVSIEDNLDVNYVSFQAALLYTSSKGERRIRVHTLCLPVTTTIIDVFLSANQLTIVGLLAKMAVDKALSATLGDAREAMINAAVDMLSAYRPAVNAGAASGQLLCPYQLRLIPLYVLAMLKSNAFRVGMSTKLDDRIFAMEQCKNLPNQFLIKLIHPDLYPIHTLDDKNAIHRDDKTIPQPPILPLSSAHIDRHGAYLMDTGIQMYLWIGAAISDQFCNDVLGVSGFPMVPETQYKLTDASNPTVDRLCDFINYLNDQRPVPASLIIMRENSRQRNLFLQHMIEDRTEASLSYNEFLLHLQKEIKN